MQDCLWLYTYPALYPILQKMWINFWSCTITPVCYKPGLDWLQLPVRCRSTIHQYCFCTPFSDKNCWGCPPKHHHYVSFFASNTCQKWTTKNPRPLVITIPPEVHVSTPMTLQIISFLAAWKLLLCMSSNVCLSCVTWFLTMLVVIYYLQLVGNFAQGVNQCRQHANQSIPLFLALSSVQLVFLLLSLNLSLYTPAVCLNLGLHTFCQGSLEAFTSALQYRSIWIFSITFFRSLPLLPVPGSFCCHSCFPATPWVTCPETTDLWPTNSNNKCNRILWPAFWQVLSFNYEWWLLYIKTLLKNMINNIKCKENLPPIWSPHTCIQYSTPLMNWVKIK